MFAAAVVPLLLAPLLIHGAPQQGQEPERSESTGDSLPPTLVNPFASTDESRRLLQSYIKANWKEQSNPGVNTWEQEVFFLFSLHDYDKSGQLDGLELMKLLSDFLSHHSQIPKSSDGVVAMVDYLLQTQDQNQDGLLAPSELLSPPIQGSNPEPIPGAGPAESDSVGGAQAQPKEQAEQEGELAQKAEADGQLDAANQQEHLQEETQEEAHTPEEQIVNRVGDPEEEKQASQQEPPQEEQPEAEAVQDQQQQQAEEQRFESNAVEHPPVHQGQPEM